MFLKLIFKFIIITALFMGIAIYGNYLTTGKLPPYLKSFSDSTGFKDLSEPDFVKGLTNKVSGLLEQKPSQSITSEYIYKWADPEGQTHLSNTQPTDGVKFEKVKLQTDVNIVPSVSVNDSNREMEATITPTEAGTSLSELDLNDVYSPAKIKELYKDAELIRDQLNKRVDNQQQLLNE